MPVHATLELQAVHLPWTQTGVPVVAPKLVMQSVAAAQTKHLPKFEPVVAQFEFDGQSELAVHAHILLVHVLPLLQLEFEAHCTHLLLEHCKLFGHALFASHATHRLLEQTGVAVETPRLVMQSVPVIQATHKLLEEQKGLPETELQSAFVLHCTHTPVATLQTGIDEETRAH